MKEDKREDLDDIEYDDFDDVEDIGELKGLDDDDDLLDISEDFEEAEEKPVAHKPYDSGNMEEVLVIDDRDEEEKKGVVAAPVDLDVEEASALDSLDDIGDVDSEDFDFVDDDEDFAPKDEDEEKEEKNEEDEEKDEDEDSLDDEDEEEKEEKDEDLDDEAEEDHDKDKDKKKGKVAHTSKDEDEDEDKEEEKEEKKSSLLIKICILLVIVIVIILLLLKSCNKPKYTVTFDTNGGSEVAEQKVDKDGKLERPSDPTREGYVFAGWYLDGEKFDFDREITSDMKLEARWEEVGGEVEVTGVSLNQSTLALVPNGTATLVATLIPADAKATNLIWSSSDPTVVTVDANGNVKALKEGTATVTVTTEDGKYKAECTVTVASNVVEVTGVKITGATSVVVTKTIKLTATVTPTNATNKNVTWTSSDNTIATVDKNGNVKGLKEGKVTITVTTANGKTATYTVTVTPEVKATGVTITGNNTVQEGKTITLKAKITPDNTTNKSVTWSVTPGTGSAKISKDGKLTGVKAGTVTVTVKTANGLTATKEITVTEKPASFVLTLTPLVGVNGDVAQYEVSITRNGTTFAEFTSITLNNGIKIMAGNKTLQHGRFRTGEVTSATIRLKDGTSSPVTVKFGADKPRE